VEANTLPEIEKGFSVMAERKAGALIVVSDPIYAVHSGRIAALAIAARLPSISLYRDTAEAGMLMSYGPSTTYFYERAAGYVDRILKGAKPADLPIEQATKFELVVNLRSAKAMGMTMPPSLLVRADQVIQ
jgi:putative ABC transport system substrate-binding protein